MKAVVILLNMAFLPISQLRLKLRLISVLNSLTTVGIFCKFLGNFLAFWERNMFSQRIG